MEGYIMTDGGYILTRAILMGFCAVHFLFGYCNAIFRFYVPPKVYHGFFITDAVVLTAFITWCCIYEPFNLGVLIAVCAYIVLYLVLLCCWALARHLMISHTKIYQMIPYYRISGNGQKGIEGYIREGGLNQRVMVFDEELYENIKDDTPINVKFSSYPPWGLSKSVEAVMEVVKEKKNV